LDTPRFLYPATLSRKSIAPKLCVDHGIKALSHERQRKSVNLFPRIRPSAAALFLRVEHRAD
jgi:hypothetical protein